ncbi:unnamed protein product [[Candida] boidinii]|nr:unnamed protein product [[Candida] boidinii]
MSLRALKRLERLKEQELLNSSETEIREDAEEDDEESDHEPTKNSKMAGGFNAFALLNDHEESEDEDENENEDENESLDEYEDAVLPEDDIKIETEVNKKRIWTLTPN